MQGDAIYIGSAAAGLSVGKKQAPISRIVCDCGNDNIITKGDETGSTLDVNCEWGNEDNVQSILDSMSGFQFLPFEASDALINPAFEIGDAVNIKGYYSGIWNISVNYGPVLTADISAGDEELDHEYPVPSEKKRTVSKRELATGSCSVGGGGIKSGTVAKSALANTVQMEIGNSARAYKVLFEGEWANSINAYDARFNSMAWPGNMTMNGLTVDWIRVKATNGNNVMVPYVVGW